MKRTVMILAGLMLGATALAQDAPPGVPQFPKQTPEEQARQAAIMDAYNKTPDTEGTGPYAAMKEVDPGLANHVVYRPKDLSKIAKGQLGIVAWGNGGCGKNGAAERMHLLEIASHGYVVIAPGGMYGGPGGAVEPPDPPGTPRMSVRTTTADVTAGYEWALKEAVRAGSPYYGKIDPAKLAVTGFSCGGLQAIEQAGDPRVKAVVIDNSGVFPDDVKILQGISAKKATLKTFHTPVLYINGGKKDIAYGNSNDDFSRIDHVPVMLVQNDAGHGGDFLKANGGASAAVAVKWLEWQLRGDKKAGAYFTGPDGIAKDPEWKVEKKNFPTTP